LYFQFDCLDCFAPIFAPPPNRKIVLMPSCLVSWKPETRWMFDIKQWMADDYLQNAAYGDCN